jgi:hypothetical protein
MRAVGTCVLLALAPACVQVAGGGPLVLGREGGRAGAGDSACHAILNVPWGALDRDYEIDITCDEADATLPAGLEPNSPVYTFAPVDVTLAESASFDVGYLSEAESQVAWSGRGETREWTVLSAEVTERTWSNGTNVVRFEHDAFGYFVLVRPAGEAR